MHMNGKFICISHLFHESILVFVNTSMRGVISLMSHTDHCLDNECTNLWPFAAAT